MTTEGARAREIRSVIERVFREEHGRIIASLVRRFGDIDVAEEAAGEALVVALEKWPENGVPPNPGGWLTTTAGNRAIDRIRREGQRDARHEAAHAMYDNSPHTPTGAVGDDLLRLIFTCCHPALAPEARSALTLRLLGGLSVPEIAAAFLVQDTTMGARIMRAKKKIAAAKIPYTPLVALLLRMPWTGLGELLGRPIVRDALVLSLVSAVLATLLSLVFGVPLAWLLARARFPGRSLVRAVVVLPMVLPPVVGGAVLLFAFGRRGLIGEPVYEGTGLLLPYSLGGVVAANMFVAMPFLVLTVEAGLRSSDVRYEEAAASLGAGRWMVLRRVTLPMVTPSLVAGTVVCFARALGEFGATVTFAGNVPGRTQTLPLAVFLALETDREAALALSLVLVAISLAVLVPLRDRWLG
jgi:molybdate transport system permease protein